MKIPSQVLAPQYKGQYRTELEEFLYKLGLTPMSIYEHKVDEETLKPITVREQDKIPIIRIGDISKHTVFVIFKTNKNPILSRISLEIIKEVWDNRNKWINYMRFVFIPDVDEEQYEFSIDYMLENAETKMTTVIIDFNRSDGKSTTLLKEISTLAKLDTNAANVNNLPEKIKLTANVFYGSDGILSYHLICK